MSGRKILGSLPLGLMLFAGGSAGLLHSCMAIAWRCAILLFLFVLASGGTFLTDSNSIQNRPESPVPLSRFAPPNAHWAFDWAGAQLRSLILDPAWRLLRWPVRGAVPIGRYRQLYIVTYCILYFATSHYTQKFLIDLPILEIHLKH